MTREYFNKQSTFDPNVSLLPFNKQYYVINNNNWNVIENLPKVQTQNIHMICVQAKIFLYWKVEQSWIMVSHFQYHFAQIWFIFGLRELTVCQLLISIIVLILKKENKNKWSKVIFCDGFLPNSIWQIHFPKKKT